MFFLWYILIVTLRLLYLIRMRCYFGVILKTGVTGVNQLVPVNLIIQNFVLAKVFNNETIQKDFIR